MSLHVSPHITTARPHSHNDITNIYVYKYMYMHMYTYIHTHIYTCLSVCMHLITHAQFITSASQSEPCVERGALTGQSARDGV